MIFFLFFIFLAKAGKTPQRKRATTPGTPVEGVRSYSDRCWESARESAHLPPLPGVLGALLTLRQVTKACGSLTSLCSGWSIDGSA